MLLLNMLAGFRAAEALHYNHIHLIAAQVKHMFCHSPFGEGVSSRHSSPSRALRCPQNPGVRGTWGERRLVLLGRHFFFHAPRFYKP